MLSPENFYYSFREHYGLPKENNLIFYPKFDGAKKIQDFTLYQQETFSAYYYNLSGLERIQKYGSILLHDQEPLMDLFYLTRTYLERWFPNGNFDVNQVAQIFRLWFPSVKRPILCHSEKNSEEISILNANGFVDCYYWYHGLISQQWFNHWRWNRSLDQIEKNTGAKKFMIYSRDFSGTRNYRRKVIDQLSEIRHQVLYDWEKEKTITSEYSARIDVDDAANSYIHIVAETIFDSKKQHFTEKSLKPMVMSQPFIIFGSPGSLEYLKSYGFQTFDSIWDESYDREQDSERRMSMIIDLIKRLEVLPDHEFQKIIRNATPIVQHNRKWFYSLGFYDRLISELESNMETAFKIRDDYYAQDPEQWKRLFKKYKGFMSNIKQTNEPMRLSHLLIDI